VVAYFAPKLGKVLGTYLSAVGEIAGVVITIFAKVLGAIKPLINFAIDGINLVIRGLNLIKPGADIGSIAKIGDMPSVAGFSGTTPGGQTFNTGTTSAGSSIPSVGTFTGGATGGATGGLTGVGAAASGGVAAASNAAALAAAGYVRLTPIDTEAYGVRNAGVAAAAAAAPATTINVTVNGALNAEGTARTIVDTLNNSYYRGTGGASNLVTT
jgi:hypothetical protein